MINRAYLLLLHLPTQLVLELHHDKCIESAIFVQLYGLCQPFQ